MANNKLLVDERQSDLGNFIVGRLLPFRKKRQVGPFTFIDHMGPSALGRGKFLDVDQHPHIGLSTLTYLFEGEIEHRDSMGTIQVITPGSVGFMTAGHGVSHTERTPLHLRDRDSVLHGYQIWVALPREKENMNPSWEYYPADEIPSWQEGGVRLRLVAGKGFGRQSPLAGHSPLFMVDIESTTETTLRLGDQIEGELAFVIVHGSIQSEGQQVEAGQMLISKTDHECEICMDKHSRILLFGGKPLTEERYLMWNFVSSSKEALVAAKKRWEDHKFPKVPGDHTYIPFPPRQKNKNK